MRSSRVTTLLIGAGLLAACSNSTGPSSNAPPSVDFIAACTDLACSFTDQTTDANVGGSIASYSWDFGDQSAGVTDKSPQHTFLSAGTYQVKLTATDNGGATGTRTRPVTVTAAQPGGPTAKFSVACASLDCTITNQSTATGATITWAWDFGDGATSTQQNPPVHSYTASSLTPFTITLTVTSDGLSSTARQDIVVAPPATLTCGSTPNCTLGLDVASTVKVTLVSSSCQAHDDQFIITAPAVDTLFKDGCYATVGASFDLNNGAAYSAGTQLAAKVVSGVGGITLKYPPTIRVTGNFSNGWTLTFDDGAGGPGEPDFNDLVILVKATPIP